MIPKWEKSLNAAVDLLKPGGFIGATDFAVDENMWMISRIFWKCWFSFDSVHLTSRYLTYLRDATEQRMKMTGWGGFPLFQWAKCKYFVYCGQKPEDVSARKSS